MSDPISPSDRYNRYAEDWRYHHKLVWEIPSVSAAIFGGITIASYAYLKLLPQSILLGVGAYLILILALAVRKHRFGADLRTNILEDLGRERNVFPIRSEEGLKYLRDHGERNGMFDNWIQYSAERGLIGFMFVISIVLAGLCGLTLYQTAVVIWDLANNGQNFNQIVGNVTLTS